MTFKRFWLEVRWPTLVVRFVAKRGLILATSFTFGAIPNVTQGAVNVRVDPISVAVSSAPRPVSASGDSFALSVTPDGAFVLFSSTADNIVTNDNNGEFIDLFLRCRTNGVVRLVTVNTLGTGGGNGNVGDANVTPGGRFVVFESDASDLATNDQNQATDVFLRDVTAGISRLVSVNRLGTASGNGPSSSPSLTPDGRYVVFISVASDLVDDDLNGIPDVFIRDMQTGTTRLVSVGAQSIGDGTGFFSDTPVVTPDGRFVAFSSTASNLVASTQNTSHEVYVRDLVLGQTIWASSNVTTATFPDSYGPVLSEDGHFVTFATDAFGPGAQFLILRRDLQTGALDVISTNAPGTPAYPLEMTPDGRYVAFTDSSRATNTSSVWLWDAQTQTATLVSANLFGQPSTNGLCSNPAISSDGRYVAFLSDGTDLVTNNVSGDSQVYVRDMQSGVTKLVSADRDGLGSGSIDTAPLISADGSLVVFDSRNGSFVPDDVNDGYDVFAQNIMSDTTELISLGTPGAVGVTGNGISGFSEGSVVSADGRLVVFESYATDLVLNDTNSLHDVFVRDLIAGTNALVSVNRFGTGGGNGASRAPSISANGRFVLFFSGADDLVANDTNKVEDVFVRDLVAGTTRLVGVNTNGTSGNAAVTAASISADGRLVAFQSAATDLASGVANPVGIFVRDLVASTTTLASSNIPGAFGATSYALPIISPDGRFLAFYGSPFPGPSVRTFVKDLQTGAVTPMNTNSYGYPITFSGDSHVFASLSFNIPGTNYQLVLTDLIQNTRTLLSIGPYRLPLQRYVAINFDGRFIALANRAAFAETDTNNVEDVYLYDVLNANLTLVSVNQAGTAAGNGKSYWPRISADGRFVAFRSAATDLVPGDANGADDIFLFDRLTGERTLLSRSFDGVSTANGFSLGLDMTPDGGRIVFNSAASDLVNGDFNGTEDVFLATLEHPSPTIQTAVVSITGVSRDLGQTTINWTASPGRSYRVQFKNELSEPSWQDLPSLVTIVGSRVSCTDFTAVNRSQRFYRLVIPNN